MHGSHRLAVAAPGATLVIEPLAEGRCQVRLTAKSDDPLTISAQTISVSMTEGGFTLTATRNVAMSGPRFLQHRRRRVQVCHHTPPLELLCHRRGSELRGFYASSL